MESGYFDVNRIRIIIVIGKEVGRVVVAFGFGWGFR